MRVRGTRLVGCLPRQSISMRVPAGQQPKPAPPYCCPANPGAQGSLGSKPSKFKTRSRQAGRQTKDLFLVAHLGAYPTSALFMSPPRCWTLRVLSSIVCHGLWPASDGSSRELFKALRATFLGLNRTKQSLRAHDGTEEACAPVSLGNETRQLHESEVRCWRRLRPHGVFFRGHASRHLVHLLSSPLPHWPTVSIACASVSKNVRHRPSIHK